MPLLALALAATMSAALNADLAGSAWRPTELRGELLTAEPPVGEPQGGVARMLVEFKPDGQISGNGGCNRFFGGYTISGNAISIGPLASTRKGCPGLMQLEVSFFATLQSAKTFAADETKLVLFSAAGFKLAEFARSGATSSAAAHHDL